MSSAGRKLLSAVIYRNDLEVIVHGGLHENLFKESELVLFQFIKEHLNGYGVIPSTDTIEEKVGDVLVEAPEPCEYYMAEVEKRFLQSELKRIIFSTKDLLEAQDPDAAFSDLLTQVSELNLYKKKKNLIDFRAIAELIHQEYVASNLHEDGSTLMFGWPTLDGMTGGLRGGDVCSIVGRPASGKTFMGLYNSHHAWLTGGVPLVVSMEMTNVAIGQRLAAMNTSKPLTQIIKGMLSSKGYTKMQTLLHKNKGVDRPYWLVDGNLTATVDDIVMLARQLKPTGVFIDGAYLLRNANSRLSRWDKLTENAEGIKQKISTDLNLPVVCSYQFSREATKKKKKEGEKAGLEDIYGSDAIGQLSSVVLGLFEGETIETEKRRRIDIIKGRNGESGEFIINWNFNKMDFSEVPTKKDKDGKATEDTENLQFLC